MREAFRLGTIFGIKVELHISFLLLMLFFAILNPRVFFYLLLLFFFVFLHELSHSIVAMRYDVKIDKITLWPIGGVASMERIPKDPNQEFKIALAGPSLNLLVALAILIPLWLAGGLSRLFPFSQIAFAPDPVSIAVIILKVNLLLGAFNLFVPALPMDGGRIFRALLAMRIGFSRATDVAAMVAKGIAVLMFLVGFYFNIILMLISVFIYLGATQESQATLVSGLLSGVKVRDAMNLQAVTVSGSMSLEDLRSLALGAKHTGYPVMEDGVPVGIIYLSDMEKVPRGEWPLWKVERVMSRNVPVCSPEEEALEVLIRMHSKGVGLMPVMEGGQLAGVISHTDIYRMIEIMRYLKG